MQDVSNTIDISYTQNVSYTQSVNYTQNVSFMAPDASVMIGVSMTLVWRLSRD